MGGVAVGTDPWAIDLYNVDPAVPGSGDGISAEDARYLLGGIMATSAPLKAFNGIIPEGGNDNGDPTGLLLTATSPASTQVRIEPGRFVAQGAADASPYYGGIKAPALLDVTPSDPDFDRLDLVVGDPSPDDPPSKIRVLDGPLPTQPGQEPVEPALPDRCVKLGTVPVSAGSSNITSVLPYRVFTSAVGGVRLVWNDQGLDEPGYPGQLRNHDGSIDQFDKVEGDWSVILGRRIDFTPVLRNAAGTVMGLGDGAAVEAWYQFLQKDVCHVSIMVCFGTGVPGVRDSLHFDPPPRAAPAVSPVSRDHALAQLHAALFVPGYNTRGQMTWHGYADAFQTGFYPAFPIDFGSSNHAGLRSLASSGAAGSGIPPTANSATLFNGVTLSVHGTYRVPVGAARG